MARLDETNLDKKKYQNLYNPQTGAVNAPAQKDVQLDRDGSVASWDASKPVYTGLPGASEYTNQQLQNYTQGYRPSESVTAAQNYLNSVIAGKPGAYNSPYQQQLDELYQQVMSRPDFKYDLNGDMLYQQYKDQYQNLGRMAMMDTMGQAAALTGGYGNSYASTAGNQAYQAYLQQLNSVVPELYQMAMNRYNQEGEELLNRLNVTASLEGDAYNRYRDTVSDWNAERGYANTDYWNRYEADYNDYQNMLNYWNNVAQQENGVYNTDREYAYSQAMAILQAGKMPSDALLGMAGISEEDAKSLQDAYKKKSSGSGNKPDKDNNEKEKLPGQARTYDALVYAGNSVTSSDKVIAWTNDIAKSYASGTITEEQANKLLASVDPDNSRTFDPSEVKSSTKSTGEVADWYKKLLQKK